MIVALEIFRQDKSLYQGRRIMGLDVGDKTVGLSLSDLGWMIASPLETIQRKNVAKDMDQLQKIIQQFDVAALVVGLPLNMNGTEGPQAQKTRDFVAHVLKRLDIPVLFWDERLSTQAVNRSMLEGDLSRKKRDKRVDQLAATFILQGLLDGLRF